MKINIWLCKVRIKMGGDVEWPTQSQEGEKKYMKKYLTRVL